ncbi:phosphoribosyl-AMP cyclohydrolase [Natronospira proteinivora]|uniref:Phosphoribosyl-AMP cyclohydrolase n=1 Tax=Natronospira proteinivora TaxID=1807133 RepID=A0ABT1GAI3_9GAMM|nr:phosphoribosyl-AMP cyclohydrolase [Natronospira proteinivora]MCP1728281.1 phosphoribosyl-AMP cyclohydrolase [Natronospira proteinivora]
MSQSTWLEQIRFNEQGLVAAIAQDADSGQVLMMAWMDREAVAETVLRGEAVYFSRSRQRLWHKGETSGHVQRVHEIRLDCDGDTLLLQVSQLGGIACHTGRARCLFRRLNEQGEWVSTDPVLRDPDDIYGQS